MADRDRGGPQVVLIAGPTASGKSALAARLAEALGGAVVNADSMQVYRELDILSARPGPEELARAPHRLYGHRPAAEACTVARWLADAEGTLADLAGAGRTAVVVGGTGLYLSSLTRGLSQIPKVPDDLRGRLRAEAETLPAPVLHHRLAAVDPVMAARLAVSDRQRILRALEVREATGRSLASFQDHRSPPLVDASRALCAVIAPDRAALHGRIAARFSAMLAQGALAEAAALDALGLDPALPAMKAIGVPEMLAAARGTMTPDAAAAAAVVATRRYARRQETWFRNQMADWLRLPAIDDSNILSIVDHLAQQSKRGLTTPEAATNVRGETRNA